MELVNEVATRKAGGLRLQICRTPARSLVRGSEGSALLDGELDAACVLVPQLPRQSVGAICRFGLVALSDGSRFGYVAMFPKPIFFDPSGKRRRVLSTFAWVSGTMSLFTIAAFVLTLVMVDWPGNAGNTPRPQAPAATDGTPDPQLLSSAHELAAALRESERTLAHPRSAASGRPLNAKLPTGRPVSVGFYVNDDDNSYPDLKRALPHLDWFVPSWMDLSGPEMDLSTDVDARALNYIRKTKPDMAILPMVQNAVYGRFDGIGLARLLADPAARRARIGAMKAFIEANKFQGIVIDFENVPAEAQPNLDRFLRELRQTLAASDYAIVLAVPFDDPSWPYRRYADVTDFMLLMGYDQHWEGGEPGSIADQSWFEKTLDMRMQDLDPSHTIVAIGGYGYDWVAGRPTVELSFQEAVLSAKDSDVDIDFDANTSNPHFSFVEGGKRHDVWFLDGVTAFNEIHAADDYQPAGYALWRLGLEDPSVWSVMGRAYGASPSDELRKIGMAQDVDIEGSGGILRVVDSPQTGIRTFKTDKRFGAIVDEAYTRVPTPFVIRRAGDAPGKIALTFDDGPDPDWTPQILDILKAKGVKASFFVIGTNAESYPDLVQRIVAEGHDIGNHTFTHPNLGEFPDMLVKLEINANQRLIEALTGRSMRLFRAPYMGDTDPTTSDEIVPIEIAQSMGFTSVGVSVDPGDWQQPTSDEIAQRTLSQVNASNPEVRGNIILLHDSGGDRSATVAALPGLIDTLKAQGYSFVPVSELAGMTQAQAMPPVPKSSFGYLVDRPMFVTLGWLGHFLRTLFFVVIWLGIARLVFLCGLALRNRYTERRRVPRGLPSQPNLQSVLVPAYNEAKVIEQTIRRILASDYSNLEVIVIDDGSTDDTSGIVRERFGRDPRVRLIAVANGGKAAALNRGLAEARGDVIVALDADTHFQRDSISRLVRWFSDPAIGAVAGNAKVGNRINIITRWQALEYVTSQNLERRALATLGCVTVVPGAIGAWRREALVKLDGFSAQTLAEDQDLTIAVQKAGYRILFDSTAIAWTEAPDCVDGLIKQRFRWAFGTLQCLWKHRDATFSRRHGSLGLIAMPQTWLFQFALTAIAPVVDLLFLWQLIVSGLDVIEHGAQFDSASLQKVVLYYIVFLAVDLGSAALAFAMERREKLALLPWLVFQRFGYRQLMYYVVLKAGLAALFGLMVGWNKLDRKSTVAVEHASPA
jgi:cellulose synthase/poly-beta-1,6-N-acetylglucosamine synthase-like glycosyltransferase/peptidoglycan/xylan/chitin deacetylase (PgdA/CDA1 family)/spore germination protein YaaH